MTLEIFLYFVGITLIPSVTLMVKSHMTHKNIEAKLEHLVEMHEHPESTGFGTVGMKEVTSENTRALRALTHYIKWLTKKQTGEDPPPPINGGGGE